LFVIEGQVELNGRKLSNGDQARIADEPRLTITAREKSELILLDCRKGVIRCFAAQARE
jgi:redox-sensitive bicupin YhaK (pirin superfamily)